MPLINVTRDSLKAEPGQFGPKHRAPGGGLAGAVKSVGDQFSSAISRISDGLRGGGAETGGSSRGRPALATPASKAQYRPMTMWQFDVVDRGGGFRRNRRGDPTQPPGL